MLTENPHINTIVVGHPITMQGTKSQQTLQIEAMTDELKQQFPHIAWIFWDERLSSKRAGTTARDKAEKLRQHAKAAAHILDLYLTFHLVHKPTH
jgi:RNase H-fold protein (predicted Holliday junction resolvase)